jgi:hypothetical protein
MLLWAAPQNSNVQNKTNPGPTDQIAISADQQDSAGNPILPRLIRLSGTILEADGTPRTGVTGVVLAVYKDKEGGAPLWTEVQNVQLDSSGHFSTLLGATTTEGLPQELFASNEGRYLAVKPEGQAEMARILMVSVPYALKAADAETLGGKPLSAFVLAPPSSTSTFPNNSAQPSGKAGVSANGAVSTTSGAQDYIAKFTDNNGTIGNSVIFESAGTIGIATTSTLGPLSVGGANPYLSNGSISSFGPSRWRLAQKPGDEANAGVIDYRNYDPNSLSINGAGTAPGNRVVRIFDNMSIGTAPATSAPLSLAGVPTAASSAYASFSGRQWHMQQIPNDEQNAGLLDYRGTDVNSFSIFGAGTAVGNRKLRLYDTVTIGTAPLTSAPLTLAGPDTPSSTTYAAISGKRLRLQINSGDEGNSGTIDYRGFDPTSLNINGAGSDASTRNVRIFDTLSVGFPAPPPHTGVAVFAGNVGINTYNPGSALDVVGSIRMFGNGNGLRFPDGSTLTSAASPSFSGNTSTQLLSVVQSGTGMAGTFTASNGSQTIYSIQNGAGIDQPNSAGVPNAIRGDSTTNSGVAAGVLGTSASYLGYGILGINLANCPPAPPKPQPDPCNAVGAYGWSANGRHGTGVWGQAAADVGDNVGVFGQALGDDGTGVFGYAPNTASTSTAVGVYGLSDAPKGTGVFGEVTSSTGTTAALYGRVTSSSGIGGQFDVATGANILVGRSGTVTPGLDPDVTQVFHVTSAGDFYGHSFNPGGADFAESVDVLGGPSRYEPGDVLMVDDSGVRRFALSNEAYSSKIAGIYSTQPGVLASLHSDSSGRPKGEVPLAVVGIVPCKVSAENGAIKAGDLLVASSKPGYAMKGTDRSKMLGAVVGKALGSLDKDTGVIEVLVSLH